MHPITTRQATDASAIVNTVNAHQPAVFDRAVIAARVEARSQAVEREARQQVIAGIAAIKAQLAALRTLLADSPAIVRQTVRARLIAGWSAIRAEAVGRLAAYGVFRPDARMDGLWSDRDLAKALTVSPACRLGRHDRQAMRDPENFTLDQDEITIEITDEDGFDLPATFTAEVAAGITGNEDDDIEIEVAGRLAEVLRIDGRLIAVYDVEKD